MFHLLCNMWQTFARVSTFYLVLLGIKTTVDAIEIFAIYLISTTYNMSGRVVPGRRREFVYPIQHGRKWLKNDSSYEFIDEVILKINVV